MQPVSLDPMELLASLTPDRLVGAYSGRQGCCCGCRGKHYTVGESKNADRQTARILGLMRTEVANGARLEYLAGSHLSVDTDNGRILVAYLATAAERLELLAERAEVSR